MPMAIKSFLCGGEKMANQKNIDAKKEQVKELAKKVKDSKLVLFTDYRGINVSDVTELRNKVRETQGSYSVIKNNIIRRALAENKLETEKDVLVGPTAVIMSEEDYTSSLKAIYNYTKTNKEYKIKGGIIEGEVKNAEEILAIAKLPSKEELLSMLAGALLGNISKLAVALSEVQKIK